MEANEENLIGSLEEGKNRVYLGTVQTVLEFEVPLALLLAPSEPERSVGHLRGVGFGVPHEELPVPVLHIPVFFYPVRPQILARPEFPVLFIQNHEEGGVAVPLYVLYEVGGLLLVVELLEDNVVNSHPEGTVLTGPYGYPPVGVLGNLTEVRGEDHQLGSVVLGFGYVVDVRRSGHVQVGP